MIRRTKHDQARPPPVAFHLRRHGPGRRCACGDGPGALSATDPAELLEIRGDRRRRALWRGALFQTGGQSTLSRLDHQGHDALSGLRGSCVRQDPSGRPRDLLAACGSSAADQTWGTGRRFHHRGGRHGGDGHQVRQRRSGCDGGEAGWHRTAVRGLDDPARPRAGHDQFAFCERLGIARQPSAHDSSGYRNPVARGDA